MALPQVGLEAVISNLSSFESGAKSIQRAYDDINKGASAVERGVSSLGGGLVNLGSGFLKMGAIAGGVALGGVAALGAGIVLLGKQALDEFANFERLSLSVQSLVAREISQGREVEQSRQVITQLTKKEAEEIDNLRMKLQEEGLERNTLLARIQEQRQRIIESTAAYGDNGLEVIRLKNQLAEMEFELTKSDKSTAEMTARIDELGKKSGQLVTVIDKVRVGQMSVSEAMGQAGPRAQELLKWIQMLAIQSPFTSEGISAAFRTALAYGFTTEQAQKLTSVMVDFASATGATPEVMDRTALALGQVQAKGRLAGQEILQLVNAGVNVTDILEEMGFTLDDVSSGVVKADDFIQAFVTTMDRDFGGAAQRQAESFSGLISSLQELKAVGLREFFTGTFRAIQPYLADFVSGLVSATLETGRIREIGDVIGTHVAGALRQVISLVKLFQQTGFAGVFGAFGFGGFTAFSEAIQRLFSLITGQMPTLTGFGDTFEDLASRVFPTLTTAVQFVIDHFEEFKAALIGIGAVVGVGVLAALVAGILALLTPINLLIAGVAVLSAAWVGNWGNIQGITMQAISIVQSAFVQLSLLWQQHWPVMAATALTAWTILQGIWNGLVSVITSVVVPQLQMAFNNITTALASLGISWSDVWNALLTAAGFVAAGIGVVLLGIIAAVVGVVSGVSSAILAMSTIFEQMVTNVTGIITGLTQIFVGITEGWRAIIAGDWAGVVQGFVLTWQGVVTTLRSILATMVTMFLAPISIIISTLTGFVTGVIGLFAGLYQQLIGASIIPDLITGIVEAFTNTPWFELGAGIIEGILKGINENVEQVYEVLKDLARTAVQEAMSFLGIGSPSTEFVPLGEGIVQGLTAGVDQGTPAFLRTLQNTLQSGIGLSQGMVESGLINEQQRRNVRRMFGQLMPSFIPALGAGNVSGADLAATTNQQLAAFGIPTGMVADYVDFNAVAGDLVGTFQEFQTTLRLEGMAGAIQRAGAFATLAQTAFERLIKPVNDTVNALQKFIDSDDEMMAIDGRMINKAQAQEILNEQLKEQARLQEQSLALQKQQADLQFLQQQISLIQMVREMGLDVSQIFGGIAFGLDASLPDLIAASSAAVQAIINQVNSDLQISSPSRVMAGIGSRIMQGMALGIQAGVPMLTQAIAGPAMVSAPALAAGAGQTVIMNNSFGGNTINSPMDQAIFDANVAASLRRLMG